MTKKYIVLHHSATPDNIVLKDFDAIKRYHLNQGWRDIGYHWVVEKVDGRLVALKGRDENDVGAHSIPRNKDSIGICIVGNFETESPTSELYGFVANLCKDIMQRHPIIEIGGHRDYDATVCPGRHFNVEKVKQLVKDDINLQDVKVIVKNKEITGKLIEGQTYVPLRELIEVLNNKISWDGEKNIAEVK